MHNKSLLVELLFEHTDWPCDRSDTCGCVVEIMFGWIYGQAAVCVHVCRPMRFCVSRSDRCVTGDGEPCSHLSPVRQQRRSTIHPHLARQRAGLQACVKHKHTHGQQPHRCRTIGLYVPVLSSCLRLQIYHSVHTVCKSECSETKCWRAHAHIGCAEIQQMNAANCSKRDLM